MCDQGNSTEEVEPKLRSLSLPHCHLSQDRETKMSNTTKVKPKMLIKETIYRTKKYCHKTFRNLKSLVLVGCKKAPENPTIDPICRSFSEKWDSIKVVEKKESQISPKVQTKEDQQYSKRSINTAYLKQEKNENKYIGRKQRESSFRAADALARKMKELDMMDVNDMDHVMDVEEVLHYYSRLTCPAYLEIVDNFFVDMYSEFRLPPPSMSVNSSMRKLGSASVHGSMRSLGPLKI